MGFEPFVPRATKQPLGVLEPPEIQIQRANRVKRLPNALGIR